MKTKDYFTSEVEIDLNKCWKVLRRRWLVIGAVFSLSTVLSVLVVKSKEPIYTAEAQLLFESSRPELIDLEGVPQGLRSLTGENNPLDTQVLIFQSKPIAQNVIERMDLEDNEGNWLSTAVILSGLRASAIPGTDVLRVTHTSSDPAFSADVVNTITDVYIQNDIQVNRMAAVSAQEFITAQLPQSEAEVAAAELGLSRFKEANELVDLEAESKNVVSELSTLESSLTELRSEIADGSAQSQKIEQRLQLSPEAAYLVGLASESPGIQEVLSQLQAVQAQLALERTVYEEVHPEIENIRRQEESLNRLLQERITIALGDEDINILENDLQAGDLEQELIAEFLRLDFRQAGLQERIEQVLNVQSSKQQRAQALPGLERQERELERKLSAAQTTYETLLSNLQQARVLENQNMGNARVVSPASVPLSPVAPSLMLYLLGGGFLGMLLGVAAAFLVDLLDLSVKSVGEGLELYEYPLLGVIPAWKKLRSSRFTMPPSVLVRDSPEVSVMESYQSLQANLKFSSVGQALKIIGITSAVPKEGKSEIAANIALTLAHLGHLVLVIDANMRSPAQHLIWEFRQEKGLSNFLTGQASLKSCITMREKNLHVMGAGTSQANPLTTSASRQMFALLKACRRAYDYVIVDMPSILDMADSLTIGQMTDGLLLVMQPGMIESNSIRSAKAMLKQSNQRVFGVIANAIDGSSQVEQHFYHNQEFAYQNSDDFMDILNVISEQTKVNGSYYR